MVSSQRSCCCIRAAVRPGNGSAWPRRWRRGFACASSSFHGHGEQAAWSGDAPMTLADEAALAAPLLEEAGGAHIVGHSYGAAVALKLATMYPESVRSVVAYEPVLFRWLIDDSAGRRPLQNIVTVADAMRDEVAAGQNSRRRSDSLTSGLAPARGNHCPAVNRLRSPRAYLLCSSNLMCCFASRFSQRSWRFSACRCC